MINSYKFCFIWCSNNLEFIQRNHVINEVVCVCDCLHEDVKVFASWDKQVALFTALIYVKVEARRLRNSLPWCKRQDINASPDLLPQDSLAFLWQMIHYCLGVIGIAMGHHKLHKLYLCKFKSEKKILKLIIRTRTPVN